MLPPAVRFVPESLKLRLYVNIYQYDYIQCSAGFLPPALEFDQSCQNRCKVICQYWARYPAEPGIESFLSIYQIELCPLAMLFVHEYNNGAAFLIPVSAPVSRGTDAMAPLSVYFPSSWGCSCRISLVRISSQIWSRNSFRDLRPSSPAKRLLTDTSPSSSSWAPTTSI